MTETDLVIDIKVDAALIWWKKYVTKIVIVH